MLQYSGMKWYLLELGCYCTRVVFYGVSFAFYCPFPRQPTRKDTYFDSQLQTRTPERLAPSKFDIWGSSHQVFRVAISFAICLHTLALGLAFTACHTLDVFRIQVAHRAGARQQKGSASRSQISIASYPCQPISLENEIYCNLTKYLRYIVKPMGLVYYKIEEYLLLSS